MDQHIIDRLNAANIPMIYHDTRLNAVKGGDSIVSWLDNTYPDDRKNGIGMHLHGDAAIRARLFPVIARGLVLRADNVFYTQMVVIRDIARSEDHPLIEKVVNCNALFIQFFCTPGEQVPYAAHERAEIEQLLLSRAMQGRRNYFSGMDTLLNSTWWSSEFLVNMAPYMRDFAI